MIAVRGYIAIGLIGYLLGMCVGEKVPDGLALIVGIPAALDLVGRRSNAPEKVVGEASGVAHRCAEASVKMIW